MTVSDLTNHFVWDCDPILFTLGPIVVRWYGLLFACGFFFGFQIITWIYKRENKPLADLDTLFMYMVAGTVIGARLGHCLFYDPSFYLSNPLKILMIWEGGLASHGATLGILLVLFLYSRIKSRQPFLWLVSRMTIIVGLAAVFIRVGNFFNSEIVGTPSELPWAVIFMRQSLNYGDVVPRHPAQLYEAFAYLITFLTSLGIYKRFGAATRPALLIGSFFTMVFTSRFFIEFLKENQSAFEKDLTWDMGQLLSIPFIIFGIWMLVIAYKKRHEVYSSEE